MVSNGQIIYKKAPKEYPIPGETLKVEHEELDIDNVPLNGGVLLRLKALSLDPFQRGRMRDPSVKSYSAASEVNKPWTGFEVGEVIRSESHFKVGQHLYGFGPFAEYAVLDPETLKRFSVIENKEGLPWTTIVGGAGMSGQTAWWGFYNIGKPKKGETIFISAAAGAVGQIVGQLAKKEGLKVVGSVGSDDKVDFIKSLGFNVAFNYKTESTQKYLEANPPDIYFDNVGGETLDAVLAAANSNARIIACGAVSQYNVPIEQRYALKNYVQIVGKQIHYEGFIISFKDVSEFYKVIPGLLASGDIKVREHVTKGLDNGEAFVAMLKGEAPGKAVISLE